MSERTVRVTTTGAEGDGLFMDVWGLDENQQDARLSRQGIVEDNDTTITLTSDDQRLVITSEVL